MANERRQVPAEAGRHQPDQQPLGRDENVTGNGRALAGVLGCAVAAAMLFVGIPLEESGRQVDAQILIDGSIQTKHVTGKQYLRAYLDIVKVPTICDGITRINGRPVRLSDRASEKDCGLYLERELVNHARGVLYCTPNLYGRTNQAFAATMLAYNVGVAGYCKSTVDRRFDAKQWKQGCDAFMMWNKAGGREIKGLTERRKRERAVCLKGL
jgi:lysozyme